MNQVSEIVVTWTPETSGRAQSIQIQSRIAGQQEWTEQAAAFSPSAGQFRFTANAPSTQVEVRCRYRTVDGIYGEWFSDNVLTAPAVVEYDAITGAPNNLGDINAGEGTKLGGIQPGATVGAPIGTNIGSRPVTDVLNDVALIPSINVDINDIKIDVAGLTATYGDTVAAAASADAAEQYRIDALAAKNLAEGAAGAANQSKIDAQAAKGQSEAFAGQAATSRDTAEGHKNSASASAGVAASTYQSTVLINGNQNFEQGTDGWSNSVPTTTSVMQAGQWVHNQTYQGRGNVIVTSTPYARNLWSIKNYTITSGRKYRARIGFHIGTSNANVRMYAGWQCHDANGAPVGGNQGFIYTVVGGSTFPSANGWVDITSAVYPANSSGFNAGTAFIKLIAWVNYDGAASTTGVDYFAFEDVTDLDASAGSAQASALSASNASTSETNAGLSASAANQSKLDAQAANGNASGHATNASNSAVAASGSAAAALESKTLAASVVGGYISPNPLYANWNNGNGVPDGWTSDYNITAGGSLTRGTGETGFGYALNLISVAGGSAYLANYTGGSGAGNGVFTSGGWYMIETDVRLLSGTLVVAGVYVPVYNSAGTALTQIFMPFDTATENNTSKALGNGTVGEVYRFRKLVQMPVGAAYGLVYSMSHWSGFGSIASANGLRWYRNGIRPANDAEVKGFRSSAEVSTLAGAVADIGGRQGAFWQTSASVGGSAATSFITVRADQSVPAAAPLTMHGVSANVSMAARTMRKISGAEGAWDANFASVEAYGPGVYAQASGETSTYKMFGIADQHSWSNPGYAAIDYAIYMQQGGTVYLYENGSPTTLSLTYTPNDYFGVTYNNDGGGAVYYSKNGEVFLTRTGVGQNRVFNFMASFYSLGGYLNNVVFGPSAPSTTSSVAIGARELALYNTSDGSNAKLALKIANGSAAFSGDIYAGGKIIQGNGNTGWEVAVKPKQFTVSDGQAVTWSNLGYIPGYTFDQTGLAPLSAGETYALSLTNHSASGATASLKINVPGTPANYSVGPSGYPGGSNPYTTISKGANPDATGGSYRFSGYAGAYAQAYQDIGWWADIQIEYTFYAKVGGTWTIIGYSSDGFTSYDNSGGVKYNQFGFDLTFIAPAGVTDFGMTIQGPSNPSGYASSGQITSVTWQAAGTSSSVRTASPNGQACKLTIIP